MPSRRTIWLRRAALMAIVAIVIGIPATLLVRSGAESGPDAQEVAMPELRPAVQDRGLAVRYRVPRGWQRSKEDGVLRLQSRDRTALVAIASPAPAGEGRRVLRAIFAELRDNYRNVDINRGDGQQVGGLDAEGAVVSARQRGRDGERLQILVAVAEGDERTYVVEVFTAASAPPERLVEAQRALNSLRLRG